MITKASENQDNGVVLNTATADIATATKPQEVPCVSSTAGDDEMSENDNNNNNDHDAGGEEDQSCCYESDYEYHDDDEASDDNNDGQSDMPAAAARGTAGLKRKSVPSFDEEDDDHAPRRLLPKSRSLARGNLKSTGLDDDDDYYDLSGTTSSNPTAAARLSLLQPSWTPQFVLADQSSCGICQDEEHTPVLDCAMVSAWSTLTRDKASGILAVDPSCVGACMDRLVAECLVWLDGLLREGNGNGNNGPPPPAFVEATAELVAVDLRRHRWNVNEWKEAYMFHVGLEEERTRLQQQLQGPQDRPYGVRLRLLQISREIARLGIDQGLRGEDIVVEGTGRGLLRDFERNATAIQKEHEAFLRMTRDDAPEALTAQGTQAPTAAGLPNQSAGVTAASTSENRNIETEEDDRKPAASTSDRAVETEETAMDVDDEDEGADSTDAAILAAAAGSSDDQHRRGHRSIRGATMGLVNALLVRPLANMLGRTSSRTLSRVSGGAVAMEETEETATDVHIGRVCPLAQAGWACEICMDDEVDEEDRISMECRHEYCRDCWGQFISAVLEDARAAGGLLNLTAFCPYARCQRKLTRQHVQHMAPILLSLYDELALNSFVQGHSDTMRWCPGPNCEQVMVHSRPGLFLHTNGQNAGFANCVACHFRYCVDCGENHDLGLPCQFIANNFQQVPRGPQLNNAAGAQAEQDQPGGNRPAVHPTNQQNATDNKIRLCPGCKVPVEKSGGCNHMTCKCGHHFCWICLADMTPGTGVRSHFCGRENPEEILAMGRQGRDNNNNPRPTVGRGNNPPPQPRARSRIDMDYLIDTVQLPDSNCTEDVLEDLRQNRQELQRFAHYYNRFVAHGQGQCFAENQCDCLAGRALDFTRVSELQNCTDTDFFQLANQRLVASRRMLKYTYCFLYYKLAPSSSSNASGGGGEAAAGRHEFEDSDCPVDGAMSSTLPISLALFLDSQERLERMTEQLSFLSENALTRTDRQRVVDMIDTVDRCMQAVVALSLEERDAKLPT